MRYVNHWANLPVGWLTLLSIIFSMSRLYHLTIPPIFFDEGIHIWLALRGLQYNTWLASEGTRLLNIWGLQLMMPYVTDILWAGRVLSVLMGLIAAWGCYLVGRSLFSVRAGLIAFGLYILSPFMLLYDRMVMAEVYLVAWTVLVAWASIKLVQSRPHWGRALLLGLFLGLTVLAKLNGVMVWAIPFWVMITLQPPGSWIKLWRHYLLAYAVAIVISLPMAWLASAGLQLVEFEAGKQMTLAAAMAQGWQNLSLLLVWGWSYLTPGIALLLGVSTIYGLWTKPRPGLLLLGWAAMLILPWLVIVIPPVITATLLSPGQISLPWPTSNQELYPRFILPAFPAFFILVGHFLDFIGLLLAQWLTQKRYLPVGLVLAILALLLWPALSFNYRLLRDPASAPLVEIDRYQYLVSPTAGYGIPELTAMLRQQAAEKGDIYVIPHDRVARLMAELAFASWRGQAEAIHLIGIKPGGHLKLADFSAQLPDLNSSPPIYWVADSDIGHYKFDKEIMSLVHVEQLARFDRPGNRSRIYLYYLSPKANFKPAALAPDTLMQANFANQMALHGYDLEPMFGPAGQPLLTVTLYWSALSPMPEDYTVFVHLLSPEGRLIAQQDSEPSLGLVMPTTTWQPGESLQDRHVLELPPDLAPGEYRLQIGVYNSRTLNRLPLLQNGTAPLSDVVELVNGLTIPPRDRVE